MKTDAAHQQQQQQQTQHTDGTTASHSGSSGRSTPNNDPAPGKLFVGGLSWQTSSEKLQEYFGVFGTVTDVLIIKDPVTQCLPVQAVLDESTSSNEYYHPLPMDMNSRIPVPFRSLIREKTERSVPMNFKSKYYQSRSSSNLNDSNNHLNGHNSNGHGNGYNDHHSNNNGKIDNSDGSFTETDSGTKSRPTSRINSNGSRTPNSRPTSRSASQAPSQAPSRTPSDLSSESLERYKHINKSASKTNYYPYSASKQYHLVTPTGMKRMNSHGSTSSTKERWK